MTSPIRSKLHRAIELVREQQVYMIATNKKMVTATGIDDGKAKHASEYGTDFTRVESSLQGYTSDPVFVISDTVRSLMEGRMNDLQKSMIDLKEAGLLALPFPIMNLEFGYKTDAGGHAHAIVHMTDLRGDGVQQAFADILAGYTDDVYGHRLTPFQNLLADPDFDLLIEVFRFEKDGDGEYLVISPSYTFLGITRGKDGSPWVKSASRPFNYFVGMDDIEAIAEVASRKDTHLGLYAFICATLIYNTQGIERERIECDKLNKKRKASGKPSIAQHHYLYLDRVYRSSAAEDNTSERYDERKHPRPHWRRAHVRGVRYGVGRTNTKQMAIPARIVAWNGKGPEPAKPTGTTIVKMRGKKK